MHATLLPGPIMVCPNGCGHHARGAATVAETGAPIGGGAAMVHDCPAMSMLVVPLVVLGVRAEARAIEREDYVNGEEGLRYADGVAVMAVEIVRDEGTDRAVFAPRARGKVDA